MIKYFHVFGNSSVRQLKKFSKNCWIDVTNPSEDDKTIIIKKFPFINDILADLLDADEQSRIDKEKKYTLIILRVPVYNNDAEVPFFTIPLGVILLNECVLTISLHDNIVLKDVRENRVRNYEIKNKSMLLLLFFMRASVNYLLYLKRINRFTSGIEKDLRKSIRNNELYELLTYEKSLVYFTTSLKSNELLLEKLHKGFFLRLGEIEMELVEDTITENKQAIEMSIIYSNILSGMMDAFASIISNNLNEVMKKLTTISLVLMIPTLIASVYGMNVHLPLQENPFAFWIVIVGSALISLGSILVFIKKKFF